MRVLLACSLGGAGHLEPVLAVERGCRRLGHDTRLVVPPSLAERAAAASDTHQVGAEPARAVVDDIWRRARADDPAARGLIDRELFAGHATRAMLPTMRSACRSWRPDLIVREPCEYATAVIAQEFGIPHAQIGISLSALERGVLDMVTPVLHGYGRAVAQAIAAAPYLSSFPASLDPSPWPDTRRCRTPAPPVRPLPDWWDGDDRPLVYVSFGTVVGRRPGAGALYRCALAAVATLPARVLLTLGALAATDLGPLPDNTHVEPWMPQADVLAHAAAVVGHGGSGTTFGALAAGVPVVAIPVFADQPRNAKLVADAGAGVAVAPATTPRGASEGLGPPDVASLRYAVERVLTEPAYRAAARRIAAEMATAPLVDEVISRLLDAA